MRTYKVEVHRDGRWWMIAVPELDQITQARRVGEIEEMARSLVALCTGTAFAKTAVEIVSITVPNAGDVLASAQLIEQLRSEADAREAQAAEATRNFAQSLASEGVPVRDTATLLRLSPQRVSQLVNSAGVGR